MTTKVNAKTTKLCKGLLQVAVVALSFPSVATTSNSNSFSIKENSANQTIIGQVFAQGGQPTKQLHFEANSIDTKQWSTNEGTFENVDFSFSFASTPVVISQVQSIGDYTVMYEVDTHTYDGKQSKKGFEILFRPRLQNINENGFETILETDLRIGGNSAVTNIGSVGGSEQIGWLAVSEASYGTMSGIPFQAIHSGEQVTDLSTTLALAPHFNSTPNVFSTLSSFNERDMAGIAIKSVNSSQVSLYIDDLRDNAHAAESVNLLAFQGNTQLSDVNGNVFGEIGTIKVADKSRDNAHTVALTHSFIDPIIFVQPITIDKAITDASYRLTDVSSNSFSGYLHSDKEHYAQAEFGDFHLKYLVVERGQWTTNLYNYQYAITQGNTGNAFAINPDTGVISVQDSAQLDYESGITQYTLTISITDGKGGVDYSTVTIALENVADSLNADAQQINGVNTGDWAGWATSAAGDVNGDGYGDIIIGAPQYDANGSNSGRSYVLFGKPSGTVASLTDVENGNGGFVINGEAANDKSGFAVAGNADINGDGLDDLVIGAPYANANGAESGKVYVVYGKNDTSTIELSELALNSDSRGFVIKGKHQYDHVGGSLALGDMNADGYADITIGEIPRQSTNAAIKLGLETYTDKNLSYTVYGKTGGEAVELSVIVDGANPNGFTIRNSHRTFDKKWQFGSSVFELGDVNSDGLNDFMINSGLYSSESGDNFVIFGREQGHYIAYNNIEGSDSGTRLVSESANYTDFSKTNELPGFVTGKPGDINGDGIDDILLLQSDPRCCASMTYPRAYVIYGRTDMKDKINLSDVAAGIGGFIIHNDASDTRTNATVFGAIGGAGDVNGDGYDDLIIGNQYDNGGSGRIYVVYGKLTQDEVYLSDIVQGKGGFYTNGNGGDGLGHWVSPAGDINGDGIGDMLFGAPMADVEGNNDAGRVYLMLGKGEAINVWGTDGNDHMEYKVGVGSSNSYNLIARVAALAGDDQIKRNFHLDAIFAGPGDDTIVINYRTIRRIDGGTGTDTIKFEGSGIALDIADKGAFVRNVEIFDIRGNGANSISLRTTVSGNGNLRIIGDADDSVISTNQKWQPQSQTTIIEGIEYVHYVSGNSNLYLQTGVSISVNAEPTIDAQTFTIDEYTAGGSQISTVKANANDLGDSVQFAIQSGNELGYFSLDADTGVLSVSNSVGRIDYESGASYQLTVLVTDKYGATATNIITIDVNNLSAITHAVPMDASAFKSIWGAGSIGEILGDNFTFTRTGDMPLPGSFTTPLFDITAEGTAGVDVAFDLHGGMVNAELPVDFSVVYPDEVEAGQPFVLVSNIALKDNASVEFSIPDFKFDGTMWLKDYLFEIKDGADEVISAPYYSSLDMRVSGAYDSYTYTLKSDSHSAPGIVDANNPLKFDFEVELPNWFEKQVKFPSNWGKWIAGMAHSREDCIDDFFAPAGEDISYRVNALLFESYVWLKTSLKQNLTLELKPVATLTLEDGTEIIFDPTQNLTVTPQLSNDVDGDGVIDAVMSVKLNAMLTNNTNMVSRITVPLKSTQLDYNIQEAWCGNPILLKGQNGIYFAKDNIGPHLDTELVKAYIAWGVDLPWHNKIIPNIELAEEYDHDNMIPEVLSFSVNDITYSERLSFDLCNGEGTSCGEPVIEPSNTAPIASYVHIATDSNDMVRTGMTLNGSYQYSDAEGDIEAGSTHQWYRASDLAGNNSEPANTSSTHYQVTTQDEGHTLQYCVTPNDGKDIGIKACSSWIEVAQLATDLSAGFGQGVHLQSGKAQAARMQLNGSFNPATTDYTFETWLKLDDIGKYMTHIFQQVNSGGTGRLLLGMFDNGVLFSAVGTQKLAVGPVMEPGKWRHVAFTYEHANKTLKIYFDGELRKTATRTPNASIGDIIIGANKSVNGGFVNGKLDETRIWTRARTADEIKRDMNMAVNANDPDLLAYYKYDEDDGTTLVDSTGKYHGSYYRNPGFIQTSNQALIFDGQNNYIDIADTQSYSFNNNSFSVEAWVYGDSNAYGDYRNIVSKKPGLGTDAGWTLRLSNYEDELKAQFFAADGNNKLYVTADGAFVNNTWNHLAAVVDREASIATLYLNGMAIASEGIENLAAIDSTAPLRIGTWGDLSNGAFWSGYLDDVRIWQSALQPEQIQANIHKRLLGNEAALVGYYPLDDNDASDITSNKNHGAIVGDISALNTELDISVQGEGDITAHLPGSGAIRFELDKLPTNGIVLLEPYTGEFTYRPDNTSIDTVDSFSYFIVDEKGHYSLSKTVLVTAIAKQ